MKINRLVLLSVGACITGIVILFLGFILIETPEEKAEEFIKGLEAGTIQDSSLLDKKTELMEFIQYPAKQGLGNTRMVIRSAANVNNAYEVKARFQAYEYHNIKDKVIDSYNGNLVIRMEKIGFRRWDILDVTVNNYQ